LAELSSRSRTRLTSAVGVASALALSAVVFVGGVTGSALPEAMLPGPRVYGVDSRSGGAEAESLARWIRNEEGEGARVLADRFVALGLYRDALTEPVPLRTSFWELFFRSGRPEDYVISELADRRFDLVAIDRRMYEERPLTGQYLSPAEPANRFTKGGASPIALEKFDAPWASRIYGSPTYSMTRIDGRAIDVCAAPAVSPGLGQGCNALGGGK
jgi:hypothetical protein